MGQSAAGLTATVAIDRFFESYYRLRPVTATFTGVHEYDRALPDWSPAGLALAIGEMKMLRRALSTIEVAEPPEFPDQVDVALADAFLEIQIAEHESSHFYRGNPAIWTGEAIFSVLSLVTRDFAPAGERLASATERLRALPDFLDNARETLEEAPAAWKEKALREVQAGSVLFGTSLLGWISPIAPGASAAEEARRACVDAGRALTAFGTWIATSLRTAPDARYSAGAAMLELLLARGHWERRSIDDLLSQATAALTEASSELNARVRASGCRDWADAQSQLATLHPTRDGYLARFAEIWESARASALAHDLVTWPDAPIRYVPIPTHTRDAAPNLYYLFYRSPAAFDRYDVYDYVVTPIEADLPEDEQERRLRAANDSVITLNHVIHHGGLGHHLQNWNAYRGASRVGQVAAIDAASRIGMFGGGTLAEGWACYACDLMEEFGFLTPLECAAQQHTRVRLLSRAAVDLSLHTGRMPLDGATAFYQEHAMMTAAAAQAEAVKNSMFPGTAVMYWLGTRGVHDLRKELEKRKGAGFSLKQFHDRFLSYGAIPVALISRVMMEES